ncbi:MAG: sporulation protein Cse60 [Bacteroidales bacterium]|nr:sporulation protein Cse60 [Bacteroidales bacterium]
MLQPQTPLKLSNIIKVETFVINSFSRIHHERLDNSINDFLSRNDIEVVDVKYNSSLAADGKGSVYYVHSAMLIYREK